ncbi:MAG: site-specific DNA-methyltransferase [Ignavibacterium sp.]
MDIMVKEQKFYKALQDVFIGAKIEGQGGFVNLMGIKSNYYRKIEGLLKSDIDKALEQYPTFRDELFDKLYSFFDRYFTESGSIYFNSTPFHNNIYEKVYTDEKDVILFWKTQMLYYVKTDRIFRSLPIEFPASAEASAGRDGFKFYFDASKIESKKANEKRNLIYEFKDIKEDNTIVFGVQYSERGTKIKQDEILKAIKRKGIDITEEQLERAFRVFEKQSEVDFFINKNAKAFLQEQFKLWSYQYFWEGAKEWGADRVNQHQILKDIAFKITDFISQFEDELVKIWNKPKFVKNSNYVITLDRIADEKLIEKIKKHKNFSEQVKEWKELGIVDENFKVEEVLKNSPLKKGWQTEGLTGYSQTPLLEKGELNPKYLYLPIDTKYFKDLELEILNQFDDLDKSLDGWLIKSENYQALNTIMPKFKEKVQTIYIDPPFNLDSSDQFLYRTNYKDANWATLLENRLRIAKDWLNEKGSIFVRCDYNGNWIVRPLMNEIFGEEHFLNDLIVARITKKGFGANRYPTANDYLFWYSKTEKYFFEEYRKTLKTNKEKWHSMNSMSGGRGTGERRIILGKLRYPPTNRVWTFSQKRIYEMEKQGLIKLNSKGTPIYKVLSQEGEPLDSNWMDIPGYSFSTDFTTENSEILLKRVIESTSNQSDLVMDYFLGSGTTTAVAHKLGRKWIGVEMGEHFYSVVLPRMKKVLAYDKSGISKEVKEYQGGGFFKYYELEQYEETLANCKYEDGDLFNSPLIKGWTAEGRTGYSPSKTPYQEYVFMKDEKMLKALEIDYKKEKVKVDLSKLYPNIDIAETLSNLTGKWIKKISDAEVEFEDGITINTKDLDYKLIKPLIWWE